MNEPKTLQFEILRRKMGFVPTTMSAENPFAAKRPSALAVKAASVLYYKYYQVFFLFHSSLKKSVNPK